MLKSFGIPALIFGFIGLILSSKYGIVGVKEFLLFFTLALADFYTLMRVSKDLIDYMSSKPVPPIQIFMWGAAKFTCLILLVAALLGKSALFPGAPAAPLVYGITTLVVVPLFGGIWWLNTNRQKSSEACMAKTVLPGSA